MQHTVGQAVIPDGQMVYGVGDIHGRPDLLDRLLDRIVQDAAAAAPDAARTLVYLGDYVDRGHDSKGVIDRLIAGPPDGFEQVCLLGNHEAWLLNFLDDARAGAGWLMNGGAATLASYGVAATYGARESGKLGAIRDAFIEALPPAHLAFYEDLALFWRAGGYVFVHAGVRPGVALADQDPDDLIWIRDDFLTSGADFGAVVVHGHTIQDMPEVRANRIGVDTGAYVTGRLTAVALDGARRRFLHT